MALISSKALAGIAALTFAVAVASFVSATPTKAITNINFLDGTETVHMTVNGAPAPGQIDRQVGEFIHTRSFDTLDPNVKDGALGGIVFAEPFTVEGISDILLMSIEGPSGGPFGVSFTFSSDPNLSCGPFSLNACPGEFKLVTEDGSLMQVGTAQIPFRDFVTGERVSLPSDIQVFVQSDVQAIPGPVVGAGLPGFLAACVSLFAWWRRRQKIA